MREKIQISLIGALAVFLAVGFVTHFSYSTGVGFPDSKPTLQSSASETADPPASLLPSVTEEQQNHLTSIFKMTESSVVQITSKVSVVNPYVVVNGSPLQSQSTRLGSGFVYDDAGHIVTNNHVVEDAKTVDVRFVNGNIYSADVIGTDPFSDIAVLRITDDYSGESLVPLALGNSSELEVGQQVIAIGNPYGLSDTMTTGIISQTGRLLQNHESGFSIPNVIQTDAAINPGNSGGPLLSLDGKVIGINTAIQSNTGEFSGIGFAVPSNTIHKIVPSLIKDGQYLHPWLGVSGMSLIPDIAKQMGLEKNYKGVLVTSVVDNSPAKKSGLRQTQHDENRFSGGDVIVAIDGHPIRGMDDLIIYLSLNKNVGDSVTMQVYRDGQLIDITAALEARPTN